MNDTLGIIFDLDGVLIDTADTHLRSWRDMAAEEGLRIDNEMFMASFGRQNNDAIRMLFGDQLSAADISRIGERKEAIYRDMVRGRMPVIDGAIDLVHACAAAGFRMAIGSSTHPQNIDLAVEELKIGDYILAAVSGHDVSRGKPDPQVFLMAAERIGLAPRQCAVIEDAPPGVQAALAGGMTAIGITTGHTAAALSSAHRIVNSMCDLNPTIVRELIENRSQRDLV